jgi:hypothetical protein
VTGVSVSGSKLGLIQSALRALRFGIEFADGLNLIAEKLDAHGAVGFGRIDIENAAAARELAQASRPGPFAYNPRWPGGR